MINGMLARLQHESAIAPMRILQDARAPMTRRYVSDGQIVVARILPPVEFYDLGKSQVRNQIGNVRWNDDRRSDTARAQIVLHDRAKRRTMQVVKMRVRYQDEVDGRKICNPHPRAAKPLQYK